MKLTFFLVLIGVLTVGASTYAQETRLDLSLRGEKISEILNVIENQSEFSFMYDNNQINVNRRIDIEVKSLSVEEILSRIFEGTNVTYKIMDKHIMLLPSEKSVIQQSRTVKGAVTDDSGASLPGVTVLIKGTTKGTITDMDGNFSIEVEGSESILVFTFVGMSPQEIQVGNKSVIDVIMSEETKGLDEVIVVGYTTKKKRDITGSISSVAGTDLAESNTESFAQALQGRSAGVLVRSNSGQPGGGVSVRIRGIGGLNNSDPLYVIDGVQVQGSSGSDNSNPLASLNPNDIETLEVLKDASSASIYGARAANGVVIITTKRGKSGKPKLVYSGSYGIQNITNPNDFGVLNARQFAERVNLTSIAGGGSKIFGGTDLVNYPEEYFPDPSLLGEGTDWMDVVFRQNAPKQEHQVSLDGGSENHNYYVSLGYFDQDGLVTSTYYKRYSFRINTDNRINKFLKFGNSLTFSHSTGNYLWATRTGNGGLLVDALTYAPTIPTHNEDGTWAGPPGIFYPPYRTPYARANSNNNDRRISHLLANFYGEINILEGLVFKSSFSTDLSLNTNESWGETYEEGSLTDITAGVYNTVDRSSTWIWSNVLNFNRDIEKHHISALAGMESSEQNYDHMEASASYLDNGIRVVDPPAADEFSVSEYKSAWSMASYFGNISYNFDNKYYLEGTIRRDGCSRFGANYRWGTFPSVSAAWRLSKENFFNIPQVSDMKIRASYGEVGNNQIGDFGWLAGLSSVLYSFGDQNGNFSGGLTIDDLANPDLKWETSKQLNIGIDLSLFNDKLTFVAEYFNTDVIDMLIPIVIPATTGISNSAGTIENSTFTANAGSLTNKGFEFELGFSDKIGQLSYSVNANLTTYNNLVTDLATNTFLTGMVYDGQMVSRTVEGGSLGEFYGYVAEGIFQTQDEVDAANAINGDPATPYQDVNTSPGDFKYKDIAGAPDENGNPTGPDGVIDSYDRKFIGSPVPDFTYGLNIDLRYKGLGLTMLFAGTYGNEILNATRINLEASGLTNFNKSKEVLNAWNGEGTSNTIARAISTDPNQNKRVSSIYVEDGSYLRLRDIQLNYTLPKHLIEKVSMSSAKVYISGQNLLTFTKYSGYDPEVGNYSGKNVASGVENDLYPQAKSISVGAIISF